MNTSLLRWSLSLALGAPAVALAARSHHFGLKALGVIEALGAILLQPRRTRIAGAALLVLSLVVASVFHGISGELPPIAFLVYLAAIGVVVSRC
jgi:hypothetical protein